MIQNSCRQCNATSHPSLHRTVPVRLARSSMPSISYLSFDVLSYILVAVSEVNAPAITLTFSIVYLAIASCAARAQLEINIRAVNIPISIASCCMSSLFACQSKSHPHHRSHSYHIDRLDLSWLLVNISCNGRHHTYDQACPSSPLLLDDPWCIEYMVFE